MTATFNSHYHTCLGHLGLGDINRKDPICVAPQWGEPEVVKILSRLYIGDVFKAITEAQLQHATVTTVLALDTLGCIT